MHGGLSLVPSQLYNETMLELVRYQEQQFLPSTRLLRKGTRVVPVCNVTELAAFDRRNGSH